MQTRHGGPLCPSVSTTDVTFELSTDQASIDDIAAAARSVGWVALDTEFLWERTYSPRLCVVQANVAGDIVLIDALEDVDLMPIAELIADPEIEVLMHAPHADLVAFALHYDISPKSTFDTQLAAGFVGYSAGMGYENLLREVLHRKVPKGEGYTDWARRPLTDKQLAYAAADVDHLVPLAEKLQQQLEEMGRSEWARREFQVRYEEFHNLVKDPMATWRNVGRRGKLGRDGQRVLRRVAAWREIAAREQDLPSGWLVKDASLVEIARRAPSDMSQLGRIRGLSNGVVDRHGSAILEAIAAADGDELPSGEKPPAAGVRERLNATRGLATSMMRMRCDAAQIAPELVGTTKDVEALAIAVFSAGDGEPDAARSPLFEGWRREIVGNELIDLLQGRCELRVIDDPPYLAIDAVSGATATP